MQNDQQHEQRRSFISEQLVRFKRYVRGRKLLKYALFAIGTIASVVMIVLYYIYYMMGPLDRKGSDLPPSNEPDEMKANSAQKRALPESILAEMNVKGVSDVEPGSGELECSNFHLHAKNNLSTIITEITEKIMIEDLLNVYKQSIYTPSKTCNDNLCGRCSDCSFYEDESLYNKLLNSVKTYPQSFMYDTTEKMTECIDGIKTLYSNFDEKYMQFLAEEIANDRILFITLRITSPNTCVSKKVPFVCSIFAEGLNSCTAHRFRLQIVTQSEKQEYIEKLEEYFKYMGYSLRASLKEACRSICGLKRGESVEFLFSIAAPSHINISNLSSKNQNMTTCESQMVSRKLLKGARTSIYTINYCNTNKQECAEAIGKYKLAHFFSLFGTPKKRIQKDELLVAFSATPNRSVERFYDSALKYFRELIRLPGREKKNPNQGKYYGSEEVYGLSFLSSLCSWNYNKRPISIRIVAKNNTIESFSACGTTLYAPCTVKEALILAPIFDQFVIFSNTASSEFIQTARNCLQTLEYKKPDSAIVIDIEQENAHISGYIRVYNPENQLEFTSVYEFDMLVGINAALEKDTKEPWLCTFMQSFAFTTCSLKPEASSALDEIVTERKFLGTCKPELLKDPMHIKECPKESQDVLDVLYEHLSDSKLGAVKCSSLLIGESLFLKLAVEKEEAGKKEVHTTFYNYKNKNLVDNIRKALKSNVFFGIFNKKDLVAWRGVSVAHNKYVDTIENASINVVDYLYYRLYFLSRPILNTIKRDNLMEIALNTDSHKIEDSFFEWLSGFERFKTLSISHPIVFMLMECTTGHSLSFNIEMLEKKVKSKAEETTCKISIQCGAFKETLDLDYIELGKESPAASVNEKSLRLILAQILNLPSIKEDSTAFLNILVETFPHYPIARVLVKEYGAYTSDTYLGVKKFKINIQELKENAKIFAKETGDVFSVQTVPKIINGNIGILLAIA
ncbi:hypothetical protein NEIRO02_0443 [Nematocida sp. AWRm79]|nr:hypothetical protein NEIRO02_0443 [Nematocida sp. AWRm79]